MLMFMMRVYRAMSTVSSMRIDSGLLAYGLFLPFSTGCIIISTRFLECPERTQRILS
jgi:hypothetical protein